jgi:hypothetical protein
LAVAIPSLDQGCLAASIPSLDQGCLAAATLSRDQDYWAGAMGRFRFQTNSKSHQECSLAEVVALH